jgi:hypothetical protein
MKSPLPLLELVAAWICLFFGILVPIMTLTTSTVDEGPSGPALIIILLISFVVFFAGLRLRFHSSRAISKN